jgi:hypothetical protein
MQEILYLSQNCAYFEFWKWLWSNNGFIKKVFIFIFILIFCRCNLSIFIQMFIFWYYLKSQWNKNLDYFQRCSWFSGEAFHDIEVLTLKFLVLDRIVGEVFHGSSDKFMEPEFKSNTNKYWKPYNLMFLLFSVVFDFPSIGEAVIQFLSIFFDYKYLIQIVSKERKWKRYYKTWMDKQNASHIRFSFVCQSTPLKNSEFNTQSSASWFTFCHSVDLF